MAKAGRPFRGTGEPAEMACHAAQADVVGAVVPLGGAARPTVRQFIW